jgi:stress response protein YsnF
MSILNYGGIVQNSMAGLANTLGQFGQFKQQQAQQQAQMEAQQAQQQAAEADMQAMKGLSDLYANNATAQELYEYGLSNPAAYRMVQDAIGFKNDQTKQLMSDTLISAMQNPEQKDAIITKGVQDIAAAGGNPQYLSQSIGEDFGDFERGAIPFLSSLGGQGAEFAKSYMSMKPQAAEGMTPAQEAVDARARERLKLDREKLKFEKEKAAKPKQKPMSVFTERTLNDAQNAAYESYSNSDSIQALADSYSVNKGDLGGGFFGSTQEAFKKFVGGEDEITNLKKQYGRIKNSLVIKSLPQGPATDKDIEIFSKGFPSENSDPEYIESFLRGMAKSQYLNGRFNEFKASYISENGNTGGLMQAWKSESKDIKNDIDQEFPDQSKNSDLSSLSDEDLLNG